MNQYDFITVNMTNMKKLILNAIFGNFQMRLHKSDSFIIQYSLTRLSFFKSIFQPAFYMSLHRRITIQYLMSHFTIFGYLTCPYTPVWYYPILTSQLNVFPSINVLVASRLVKANNPDRFVTIHKKGEGLLNIISLIGSCSVSRLAFLHFLIWLLLHISISTIDSTQYVKAMSINT